MIELGRFGTMFIVSKSDLETTALSIHKSDLVSYKDFTVIIRGFSEDGESVIVQLVTNNQDDYIPIVI